MHYEILCEEPSAEAFLREVMPRFFAQGDTFEVYPFQGKSDLLTKLDSRLQGYSKWMPNDYKIIILLDRDNDDCSVLKKEIVAKVAAADLRDKSTNPANWNVATRVICEELEAWYFGDWDAARAGFPRLPENLRSRAAYRDSDAIAGGTWEAFERILQTYNYQKEGLRKIEVARTVGSHFDSARCNSPSWKVFAELFENETPVVTP